MASKLSTPQRNYTGSASSVCDVKDNAILNFVPVNNGERNSDVLEEEDRSSMETVVGNLGEDSEPNSAQINPIKEKFGENMDMDMILTDTMVGESQGQESLNLMENKKIECCKVEANFQGI